MSEAGGVLAALPTHAHRACEESARLLREALARVESGETIGVVVVEEHRDTYSCTHSPSIDKPRRVGFLASALHHVIAGTGEAP